MSTILSKSRYVLFSQCPKLLWLSLHKPQEAVEDKQAATRLENGIIVGNLAKNFFGDCEDATIYFQGTDRINTAAMIVRTEELMKQGATTIAEAAFIYDGCYCAVDILHKEGDGWAIYEVKSTTTDSCDATEAKHLHIEHINDVAFQRWVLEHNDVNIVRTHLLCLNRDYVRGEELDIQQLFYNQDIAEEVSIRYVNIALNIEHAKQVLMSEEPNICAPTEQCSKKCSFWKYCTHHLPSPNVFDIMGMQYRSAYSCFQKGFISFEELLSKPDLNPNYEKVVNAELHDIEYIDSSAIRDFLNTIRYPLYHLDFETMQPVIPLFKGTKPYQQIPFQYSLHIQRVPCGDVEHKEFLAESGKNPLRAIAESLVRDIPFGACSLAYNKAFEQTRLKELAEMFPDLRAHLLSIRDGMIDLDVPFQKKQYYTKAMKGSFSIKYVLPALFPNDEELDYHKLEDVHNGGEAMSIFPKIQFMPKEEQQRVRKNLLKYCGLDTYAMVKVLGRLYEVQKYEK